LEDLLAAIVYSGKERAQVPEPILKQVLKWLKVYATPAETGQ
jgi:hypothetical protein